MTAIYRTHGTLQAPVKDLFAAQEYLREDDMTEYLDDALKAVVLHVEWNLNDPSHWEVTVIAKRRLLRSESERLSAWISGQNSDGLGEGFEQQHFAEYYDVNDDPYDPDVEVVASFDWQTNKCELALVKAVKR